MDKEKVKMLQESLEYFQQMQEDDTLMEIIFKTSDGKLHGIGTPTALKLLLEVAVIELERQLHSARFGDAPEQLTMCREYKTAMELERRLNDYSFDTNRFAESIPYMHRTLQQTFFRLVKASILHMAQQKPASIDGAQQSLIRDVLQAGAHASGQSPSFCVVCHVHGQENTSPKS